MNDQGILKLLESLGNPRIVEPEGPTTAKIAIVGEAPGVEEITSLKPFVGSSGRLLNHLLIVANISRNDCYVTNVIKEHPENNDISHFLKLNLKNCETERYVKYKQILGYELSKLRPNVVCAMGATALYALTGERKIGNWRGSIMESTLVPGLKVIPTFHPANAMREYVHRYVITSDLEKIYEESDSPGFESIPKRTTLMRLSKKDTIDYIRMLGTKDLVGFDIETLRTEVHCVGLGPSTTEAICIPFYEGTKNYWTKEDETDIWIELAKLFENQKTTFVGQNLMFDNPVIYGKYGCYPHPCHDTMVAHKLLYPDFVRGMHGLKFLSSHLTNEPYWKDDGKEFFKGQMKLTGTIEKFWEYNGKDTMVTLECWYKLEKELKNLGLYDRYLHQMKIFKPLTYMQTRGIKVDHNKLKEKRLEAEKRQSTLQENFDMLTGGIGLNPRSTKQLQHYFYFLKGIKPYKNRKTGKPTTDKTALKRLAVGTSTRPGIPEAQVLIDLSFYNKLLSTYLSPKFDKDKRLRGSYNPVGTKAYRISSSESVFGTGTNMQNRHPWVLECLLADEGMYYFNVDLSKSHDKIIAYVAPDRNLIECFETGKDIHRLTASGIFNKPYDEVTTEPNSCHLGSGQYSERFWGKKTNHSCKYDIGIAGLAAQLEISYDEAAQLKYGWENSYPGVQDYRRRIRHNVFTDGVIEDLFGGIWYIKGRRDSQLLLEAYAWPILATEAYIMHEYGLCEIFENQDKYEHLDLLNFNHDSLEFQLPISLSFSEISTILNYLKSSLCRPINYKGRQFSMGVDFEVGYGYTGREELSQTINVETVTQAITILNSKQGKHDR